MLRCVAALLYPADALLPNARNCLPTTLPVMGVGDPARLDKRLATPPE